MKFIIMIYFWKYWPLHAQICMRIRIKMKHRSFEKIRDLQLQKQEALFSMEQVQENRRLKNEYQLLSKKYNELMIELIQIKKGLSID